MPLPPEPIVVASRNRKKVQEISEILSALGIPLVSISEFPDVLETIEDGATFADNAAKKAREPALLLGRWVIGEDSGLAVDALQGAPGVFSARYAGEPRDDEANNCKLQAALAGVPPERRTAGYVCTIALADPQGEIRARAEGTCRGVITTEPRGVNGFGYDPYFMIPEYHQTFGELSSIVKHQLSHRARAFAQFVPQLRRLLNE